MNCSRLVHFAPESCVPFAQISSIFQINGRESLKLVPEMAVKKWNTNFRLEHAVQKNGNSISYNPFLQEIFHRNDPKSRIPFTF